MTIGPGRAPGPLEFSLFAADGRELLRYAPRPRKNAPLPLPVTPPAEPKDVPTNEELYLAGQRLEQFHNPALEPYPYYEEALRHDPSDVRVNTALGIMYLKRGMYREAEARLRAAVARLTSHHTRPRDGEGQYYLGVALRRLGRAQEAEDALQRSAWSPAWKGVAFHELAEMASMRGDLAGALSYIDRALEAGPRTAMFTDLKAALLRRLGRTAQAAGFVSEMLRRDPLDAWALYEAGLLHVEGLDAPAVRATAAKLDRLLASPVPNLLELALDYANAGFWKEAAGILGPRVIGAGPARNPLPAYLYAYALDRSGQKDEALDVLRRATAFPPDLVFPFELEFLDVFEWAMEKDPSDARAPYYLGNLLFDLQPERAILAWERARELDPANPIVHRNLGLAYARVKNDLAAAVASLERAVASNMRDARFYYELDLLYEAAGKSPAARLALLEKNHAVIAGNDNALAREAGLLLLAGRSTRALEILKGHHFHVWEGGGEIHGLWVEANLAEGRRCLEKKDYRRALEASLNALSYPANLDVGPPSSGPGSPKIFFHIGLAQESLRNQAESVAFFEKAATFRPGLSEQAYYSGLALAKLGRMQEAGARFENLVKQAREALAAAPAMDFFEKFGERRSARAHQANLHFLAGLGLSGLGKEQEAQLEFGRAVAADPGHLEARRFLKK